MKNKDIKQYLQNINYFVFSFFLFFFLIGIFILSDYGISSDEVEYRHQGAYILNYVLEKLFPENIVKYFVGDKVYPSLIGSKDISYFSNTLLSNGSTFFHSLATFIEFFFGFEDQRNQFLLKHFLTFLVSFTGLIYFYFLLKNRFSNWIIAIIGVIFFILSPKIFAEFFFSPNDIVFAFFMVITVFYALNFFSHLNYKNAIICGVLCAATMATRVMGFYLFILIMFTVAIIYLKKKKYRTKKEIISIFIYIFSTILFYVIFAPPMWEIPLTYLQSIFGSVFFHRYIPEVLFRSEIYSAANLPWNYLIYWISVSTPVLYLFFFIFGFFIVISTLYKRQIFFWKSHNELVDIFCFGLFLIPVLGTLILSPTDFNGWRHTYFIYPFFIYTSILGFNLFYHKLKKNSFLIKVFIIIIAFNFLLTLKWMIKNHPYQNIYFNVLSDDPQKNMALDYYGLSNTEALNHILEIDKRKKIYVGDIGKTFTQISLRMLDTDEKKRIDITNLRMWDMDDIKKETDIKERFKLHDHKIDYIIVNQNLFKYRNYLLNQGLEIIYEIKVDDIIINSIFKNTINN